MEETTISGIFHFLQKRRGRSRIWLRGALLLGLLGPGSTGATASSADAAFELHYELHAGGVVIGETHMSLFPLGDHRFAYESKSEAVGIAAMIRNDRIVERSEFSIDRGQLRSEFYRYDRSRGDRTRAVEIEFDWNAKQARNTVEGDSWQMPVPPGTLDKLNYILVLMRDLSARERTLSYPVADGGTLKSFDIEHVGEDTIATVLGETSTVVVRRSRKNGRRITTLWCAPALGFAPVQIEHSEPDGNVLVLRLKEYRGAVRAPLDHHLEAKTN